MSKSSSSVRAFCTGAFVMLETLFSLMLGSSALLLFGFYLSIPKFPPNPRNLLIPKEQVGSESLELSSPILRFRVLKLRGEGGASYRSLQVLE